MYFSILVFCFLKKFGRELFAFAALPRINVESWSNYRLTGSWQIEKHIPEPLCRQSNYQVNRPSPTHFYSQFNPRAVLSFLFWFKKNLIQVIIRVETPVLDKAWELAEHDIYGHGLTGKASDVSSRFFRCLFIFNLSISKMKIKELFLLL